MYRPIVTSTKTAVEMFEGSGTAVTSGAQVQVRHGDPPPNMPPAAPFALQPLCTCSAVFPATYSPQRQFLAQRSDNAPPSLQVCTYAALWPSRRLQGCEVVAVAARDGGRAAAFAKRHG